MVIALVSRSGMRAEPSGLRGIDFQSSRFIFFGVVPRFDAAAAMLALEDLLDGDDGTAEDEDDDDEDDEEEAEEEEDAGCDLDFAADFFRQFR